MTRTKDFFSRRWHHVMPYNLCYIRVRSTPLPPSTHGRRLGAKRLNHAHAGFEAHLGKDFDDDVTVSLRCQMRPPETLAGPSNALDHADLRIKRLGMSELEFAVRAKVSPNTVSVMARGGTSPRMGAKILAALSRMEAAAKKRARDAA